MNNIEYCTIFSPLEWRWGKSRLIKKCCNNPHGVPVLAPQHQLSEKELRELDKGVLKIFYEMILLTEILSATIVQEFMKSVWNRQQGFLRSFKR